MKTLEHYKHHGNGMIQGFSHSFEIKGKKIFEWSEGILTDYEKFTTKIQTLSETLKQLNKNHLVVLRHT